MQSKLSYLIGLFFVCTVLGLSQTTENQEVTNAKAGIEKLRALVEAGAVPRAQLEQAEDRLADAEDAALLRKTLYGQELTDEQCDDMIAAVNRRLERREKALAAGRKLVEAKVASELSLATFLDEVDGAKKEVELAQSRAKFTHVLADMAHAEEEFAVRLAQQPGDAPQIAERFDGDGIFSMATFARVDAAFEGHFGKSLPVSAMGETAVHKSLGFDHRGRVDVAVFPDAPEGVWLREYLTRYRIPFFAFRQAVRGKATGAHIHIGPMSTRLKLGG
jgi:hypothetical protein